LINFSIDADSQIDFAGPASNFARNEMGRSHGNGHAPEHHRGAISMMFEAILSALTLIGYIVPQVIWALRGGR
jgi:hypothetical protein